MVINGVLPVDQLRDSAPPVNMVASLIPRHVFEEKYGIMIPKPREGEDPERPPTAEEILSAYGCEFLFYTDRKLTFRDILENNLFVFSDNRGFMTQRGLPDVSRSARCVLKDFVAGKLLYCYAPPEVDQAQFHTFPERSGKSRPEEKHQNVLKTFKVRFLLKILA